MYIGVGVSVGVVVLIAAGLILISGTVCLRRRSKKKKLLITSSNVAYHSTSAKLSVTHETSAVEYDYVSTACPPHPDHTLNVSGNPVYCGRLEEIVVEDNEAYIATKISTVNGGGKEEEYECTYYL